MIKVTLDEIIKEFLVGENRGSLHYYDRYLMFAIRGLKELHYDVDGVMKLCQLSLSDSFSATLPDDYINTMAIGILRGDGTYDEIYRDNKLIGGPDREVSDSDIGSAVLSSSINGAHDDLFRNGEVTGGMFGQQPGGIYTYNIDEDTGTVSFSSNVSGTIYLMYLSDPKTVNGEYVVHPFMVEPLQKWIYYNSIRWNKRVPRAERKEAFHDYVNAKHHSGKRFAARSRGELINESRKTFAMVPKY